MNEVLWVERYAPKTVQETIIPERMKKTFQQFVDDGEVPNLLLTGGPGVGKTTIAKAMLRELEADFIIINGSNEGRLIDTLRTTIANYASSVSLMGGRKYVIIDEADYCNMESVQPAMRNFIEAYQNNCGFILTCNFENKILEPLKSRMSVINFSIDKKEKEEIAKEFFFRCVAILTENGVEHDKKVLAAVVTKFFPDFRRTLNELQRYSAGGKIDTGILTSVQQLKFRELIKALSSKEFNTVRQWVGEYLDNDFDALVRMIYETSKEFVAPESVPELVTILADYQYKNAFVADREINTVAMLVEIMISCKFKK